jgi:hypothetical protein
MLFGPFAFVGTPLGLERPAQLLECGDVGEVLRAPRGALVGNQRVQPDYRTANALCELGLDMGAPRFGKREATTMNRTSAASNDRNRSTKSGFMGLVRMGDHNSTIGAPLAARLELE